MRLKITATIVILACLLVGAGFLVHRLPPSHDEVYHSSILSEITAHQVVEHIHALGGKVVLVNFWASWCEPCKREFPQLLQLREAWADKGLRVMFITIDDPQDLPSADTFLQSQKVSFMTFAKGAAPLSFVSELFPKWEGAVPTSLLFNNQAKLIDAWEGDATKAEFEDHVRRSLGGS